MLRDFVEKNMINETRLQEVLTCYKHDFIQKQWPNENYKWEAVKCFQDNWNVDAPDFSDMLVRSFAKTGNLLASMNNFPARVITRLSKSAPEEVKALFIALFDETQDVVSRVLTFKEKANLLFEKSEFKGLQSFQHENAITTYLWLRYPDKYYIYKYGEIKNILEVLECNIQFKKGEYAENLRLFYALYDEICASLKKDKELVALLKSQLLDTCYQDSELKTLTIDVGFYMSNYYRGFKNLNNEWWPKESDYSPNINVDEWISLLAKREVFNVPSLEIMKRFLDYGGSATCTQIAQKYGKNKSFYTTESAILAQRIAEQTGCPILKKENGNNKWWPILYIGKKANDDEEGCFIWKLREELEQALRQTDLSNIQLYASKDQSSKDQSSEEQYSKKQFLDEVYMSEEKYSRLVSVLLKKKNIILQGAPGVGKTFAAKRLAYSIMGEKDEDRIEFIQFHQNYSYEDFIMGFKPEGDSFELKYGIFYNFCQKATDNPDKDYFFIIDEINRGNMSKIFGELLMLIEKDYRGTSATLAYNGLRFSVPERLHIIGLMNTADRSLAMIDYALRRRFSFFNMEPGFNSEGFIKYKRSLHNEVFDMLIEKVLELNQEITKDRSLGKGFCIGHSYFCGSNACTTEWMMEIVDFDIIPLLSEYWFDDPEKVQYWENVLHGIFQ